MIRFQLEPLSYDQVVLFALMDYTADDEERSEVLGAVYEELPVISLNAPKQANTDTITVSGATVPGKEVTLYVDGVEQTSVTANRVGDYSSELSLGEVTDGQRFTVTAGTGGITAEKTLVYRADAPVLQKVAFEHTGISEFTSQPNASIARYPILFVPTSPMKFTVTFENPDTIDTVYAVSTRGTEEKIIVCDYDEATGAFVGSGYFDETNKQHVPGDFTIDYVPKAEPLDFTKGFDYTSQEKFNQLPESWQNAEVTVNENTDTKTDLSFKIPEADGTESSFRAVTETTAIPSHITADNAAQYGYTPVTDASGNQVFGKVYEADGGLVSETLDFIANDKVQSTISDAISGGNPVSGKAFALNAVSMFTDYADGMNDFHEIWSDIYNSNLSADEQTALMSDLGVAVLGYTALTCFQAVALVGFFAVGIAAASFAAPAAVAFGLVAAVIGGLQIGIKAWMNRKMYGRQSGFSLRTKWHIDPSGYVYNNQTEEVIPGATVTVHWIPYDGTDETYWDEKPADDVYGEPWDASEFSQFNPLKTDITGHYAWDVPEGWWRVKAEHPDYETTWSDWVPVPPPQTEVHIGMTPLDGALPGDLNGDEVVTSQDAIWLLYNLTVSDTDYPLNQECDFDGSGTVDSADAVYLLKYSLFPDTYPLAEQTA